MSANLVQAGGIPFLPLLDCLCQAVPLNKQNRWLGMGIDRVLSVLMALSILRVSPILLSIHYCEREPVVLNRFSIGLSTVVISRSDYSLEWPKEHTKLYYSLSCGSGDHRLKKYEKNHVKLCWIYNSTRILILDSRPSVWMQKKSLFRYCMCALFFSWIPLFTQKLPWNSTFKRRRKHFEQASGDSGGKNDLFKEEVESERGTSSAGDFKKELSLAGVFPKGNTCVWG